MLDSILSFTVKGNMAHFSKFYTNKNALTYRVPPRTVLMGMVASILELPRNSYYELLNPDKAKFSTELLTPVKKIVQCINEPKYVAAEMMQVRKQFLLPQGEKMIKFRVFFAHEDSDLLDKVAGRIENKNYGHGLFFGLTELKASAQAVERWEEWKVKGDIETEISTITFKENVLSLETERELDLEVDKMPINFEQVDEGRLPKDVSDICCPGAENTIPGYFSEVISLPDRDITFFTPLVS